MTAFYSRHCTDTVLKLFGHFTYTGKPHRSAMRRLSSRSGGSDDLLKQRYKHHHHHHHQHNHHHHQQQTTSLQMGIEAPFQLPESGVLRASPSVDGGAALPYAQAIKVLSGLESEHSCVDMVYVILKTVCTHRYVHKCDLTISCTIVYTHVFVCLYVCSRGSRGNTRVWTWCMSS
jgi:hypothetical protein